MRFNCSSRITRAFVTLFVIGAALCGVTSASIAAQGNDRLPPLQRRIESEKQRLRSPKVEERRDALMKLGAMKHPDASRAAAAALTDPEPAVRVTAAHAVGALPPSEVTALLIPLLKDKLEFVRREAADALGEARRRAAAPPLI